MRLDAVRSHAVLWLSMAVVAWSVWRYYRSAVREAEAAERDRLKAAARRHGGE